MRASGAVAWNELSTNDPDKAAVFYKEVLDVETVTAGPTPYTELFVNGKRVAGILQLSTEMAKAPSSWDAYFGTGDVSETLEKVKAAGGRTLAGPIDLPDGGQLGVIEDPQGAVFKVIKMGEGSR